MIRREHGGRGLCYSVIDGVQVRRHLQSLVVLYADVNELINRLLGVDVVPMKNSMAGINVNVTPPGGSYRWHYDRNVLTATLYLNQVTGGDIELCPNFRISRSRSPCRLARAADRLLQVPVVIEAFGRKVAVSPRPGVLVLMRGDRCLHSVTPVGGTRHRVNIVMSFDDADGVARESDELDTYLYSQAEVRSADPNYQR
jgi:hypothetical protein